MTWFSLGSGSRPANQNACSGSRQADRVVVEVFADLHEARYLKNNQLPGISPSVVQRFERKAWNLLINYLIKLPPLPSDE